MKERSMSVAGSFYPAEPGEIERYISHFNALLDQNPETVKQLSVLEGRAVIVPHAGWVYSGFTANVAYRVLEHSHCRSVVVIGPSHRVGFEGVSIADMPSYRTPAGAMDVDTDLVDELKEVFGLRCHEAAHHEHSTEVQMPLIHHYLPNVKIVEMVYAYAEPSMIEPIIDYLLERPDTAIVISTDLSHYYSQTEANKLDALCLEAISSEESAMLHSGCEACGAIGVEAMLNSAKKRGMKSTILDYRTSADASGDTTRVVGYVSALFT